MKSGQGFVENQIVVNASRNRIPISLELGKALQDLCEVDLEPILGELALEHNIPKPSNARVIFANLNLDRNSEEFAEDGVDSKATVIGNGILVQGVDHILVR